ncbi:hypothetical protein GF325_05785 [Candidatus Bathyarchaeota archaeon]|nr:hypothetical protein [Candidatus Bathyarchaeota archaeon]
MDVDSMEKLTSTIKEHDGYINIITHNDPDGILAAVITVRALIKMDFDDIGIFFESPSAIQSGNSFLLDEEDEGFVGGFIIILDLPHDEHAHVWIDHHDTTAVPSDASLFVFHDTGHSAATLAYMFFKQLFKDGGDLIDEDLLDYVDARDTGREPKRIAPEFEQFSMAIYDDRNDYDFMVDLIFDMVEIPDLTRIVGTPEIQRKVRHQQKKIKRGMRQLKDILVFDDFNSFLEAIDEESNKETTDKTKKRYFFYNGFLFYDESDVGNQDDREHHSAALPYFILNPQVKKMGINYRYMLVYKGDDRNAVIHCTVSVNQARKDSRELDASKYAETRGGGGHWYAAGFRMEIPDFFEVIKDIHEYYG